MRYRYSSGRSVFWGVSSAALLLANGGCVPVNEELWVEFFRDLLLNATAAFLL
jgi:hypothetical protein